MPQASLRDYFLKDYKGGGVFEHEAYEHYAPEWCLDPTRALASRHATVAIRPVSSRHVVTQQTRLQPQQQLLAGVAGCPGPDSVQWKWRS